MTFDVSIFRNAFDRNPLMRSPSVDRLCDSLTSKRVFAGLDEKRRLPAWSPAKYPPNVCRGAENVQSVSCLVLDHDTGRRWWDASAVWDDWFHIVHTSWSHTPEHHKFRIVLPLARPVLASLWHRVFAWAMSMDDAIDPKCKDPSRLYFLPAVRSEDWPWLSRVERAPDLLDVYQQKLPELPRRRKHVPLPATTRVRPGRARREGQRRLKLPAGRLVAARLLRAGVSGYGRTARASGALCPQCGKTSVWWLIEPERMMGARCDHRKSCGWAGWLDELLDAVEVERV